jgi:FkbM family methyltransferase
MDSLLKPGAKFVDVGAHLGYFTIVALHLGRVGRVVSFEPDPLSYRMLAENVRAAKPQVPIDIRQEAVGAFCGRVSFAAGCDVNAHVGRGSSVVYVPQVRLDDLNLKPPLLIKVDVEGAEIDVLRGAGSLMSPLADVAWIIEVHGPALEERTCRLLERKGYACTTHQPVHPTYPEYRQRYVVAVRRLRGSFG